MTHWATMKGWIPPELIRIVRAWSGRGVRFRGSYDSWEEASRHSQGYAAEEIANRVLASAMCVRDGRAVFERDGVLFDKPDFAYPLVATLLKSAALHGGRLHVLDFGGALGSSYFQCKPWLAGLASVRWRVVEQPHYVRLGRAHLADGNLDFAQSIDECAREGAPAVALLSGVLQYLPDPATILHQVMSLKPEHLVIDRTPVIKGEQDRIAVQVVPKYIVRASYPVRLFCRSRIDEWAGNGYRLVSEFPAVDGVLGGLRRRIEFKGFIFERLA